MDRPDRRPKLSPHVRIIIFIAMLLGLRASEVVGLRWGDVNFEKGILHVRRSFVGKLEDDTKTDDSAQELPIHDDLRLVLEAWREEQEPINGWLFGNIATGRLFWRDSLQVDQSHPGW
jgi:integrase